MNIANEEKSLKEIIANALRLYPSNIAHIKIDRMFKRIELSVYWEFCEREGEREREGEN